MNEKGGKRKQQFRTALAFFGESQNAWATRHGVTSGHLSNYWRGRESKRLDQRIDRYIAEFHNALRTASRAA